MAVKMEKRRPGVTERVLRSIESRMGLRIPADYREFLRAQDGGVPQANVFEVAQIKSGSGVNEFLAIEQVLQHKDRLGPRLVDCAWPVALAEGGNLVCLAIGGDAAGVYFWDHELEADEADLPSWRNMFLLACTFSEFWQSLREFDASQVVLKPGQVKSVWVSPALREKLKRKDH